MGYGMGDPLARPSPMWTQTHSEETGDAPLMLNNLIPFSEGREQWRGEASPP
jgi:hypothetical protein